MLCACMIYSQRLTYMICVCVHLMDKYYCMPRNLNKDKLEGCMHVCLSATLPIVVH